MHVGLRLASQFPRHRPYSQYKSSVHRNTISTWPQHECPASTSTRPFVPQLSLRNCTWTYVVWFATRVIRTRGENKRIKMTTIRSYRSRPLVRMTGVKSSPFSRSSITTPIESSTYTFSCLAPGTYFTVGAHQRSHLHCTNFFC
jgi:hypothetical protein